MARYGKFFTEQTTDAEDIMATSAGGEYTDAVLRADGWYPIVEVGEPSDSPYRIFRYTLVGDENGGHIEERYTIHQQARTFSKLKLLQAAARMQLAGSFISMLQEDPLLYEMWSAAQNLSEDNEFFQNGVALVKQRLNLTDEQIESVLNEATI